MAPSAGLWTYHKLASSLEYHNQRQAAEKNMGMPPGIGNGGSGGEKAFIEASGWKAGDWAVRLPSSGEARKGFFTKGKWREIERRKVESGEAGERH
jgi:hypothetical protein